VFILKIVKVLCFDTLSQVLILKGVTAPSFARDLWAETERLGGAGFARRLRRLGWGADFMSYDSTKTVCCQEKYIVGELLVRTDWEVIGRARVTKRSESGECNGVVLAADAGDT
jgi:hypothetical protein